MDYKIIWTEEALKDLDEIHDNYIFLVHLFVNKKNIDKI